MLSPGPILAVYLHFSQVASGGSQKRGRSLRFKYLRRPKVNLTMSRILVVEDEFKLRQTLSQGLTEQGYQVVSVGDGTEGLAIASAESFDCILLDMMLPGCDGLEIVRTLRAAGNMTPMLVLTARGAIEDRVVGLDSGADDYLTKPFSWAELLARVRVCLRRQDNTESSVLRFGDLVLDCTNRQLEGECCVELTIRECELLAYLIRHQGKIVSREELARDVWREPLTGLTNVIEVYISYLRKKLVQIGDPVAIKTVRGLGYQLDLPR